MPKMQKKTVYENSKHTILQLFTEIYNDSGINTGILVLVLPTSCDLSLLTFLECFSWVSSVFLFVIFPTATMLK